MIELLCYINVTAVVCGLWLSWVMYYGLLTTVMKGLDMCVSPSSSSPFLPIPSKPIHEGKLFELRFGHKEVRLHGVSQ